MLSWALRLYQSGSLPSRGLSSPALGGSREQDAGGDELWVQAAPARAVHGRRTLDGAGVLARLRDRLAQRLPDLARDAALLGDYRGGARAQEPGLRPLSTRSVNTAIAVLTDLGI